MRVALVRAASSHTNDIFIDEHLGLGYLAAALDANTSAISRVFEEPAYSGRNRDFLGEVVDFAPDIVGFTVDYTNACRTADISAAVRGELRCAGKQPLCVWGGHHASLCASAIVESSLADYVLPGNAEASFCELVLRASEDNLPPERVFFADRHRYWDPSCIDSGLHFLMPMRPRRDTLDILAQNGDLRAARIVTSRGCPYSCSFCTTPTLRERAQLPVWQARPAEDVVQEIAEIREAYGVRTIYVNDDLYIDGSRMAKQRALKIASLLMEHGIDVKYKTQLRIDSLTPHRDDSLLLKLRESGMSRVFLGVETGIDRYLRVLGKRVQAANARAAVEWFEANGVHVTPGRILFMPETTWEDLQEAASFFASLTKAFYLLRRPHFRLMLFPGTVLYKAYLEAGRIARGEHLFSVKYSCDHSSVSAFCDALEEFYPRFIAVAADIFGALSLQYEADHDLGISEYDTAGIREASDLATVRFMRRNIELRDGWRSDAFHVFAAEFLEDLGQIRLRLPQELQQGRAMAEHRLSGGP